MENQRIFYIDSGRALASILGIFFHTALVFSSPWIVNIDESQYSRIILVFQSILPTFRMPLFLFVAGFFSVYALKKYELAGFLKHRAYRILLPFCVSLVTLIPVHTYFKVLHRFGDGWREHIWSYLNPLSPEFDMEHLWFLYFLVIYAGLISGTSVLLKKVHIPDKATKLLDFLHHRASVALIVWCAMNIVLVMLIAPVEFRLGIDSTWLPLIDLATNLPMFLFGCYCFLNKEAMDKLIHPKWPRIIGTVLILAVLFPLRLHLRGADISHAWSVKLVIDLILRWLMTISVLGVLRIFLNRGRKALTYLSGASYPVYLFHQPIIVMLAYHYVKWNINLPAELGYVLVCLLTVILTYASYEIIVRRNSVGTFLFTGMKRK